MPEPDLRTELSKVEAEPLLPIEKMLIVFKHVSRISENDVDKMIVARETRQRRH